MIRWSVYPCRTPEHSISTERWNGGSGQVLFNYVQQSPPDYDPGVVPEIDLDPWGVVPDENVYRGPNGS